MPQADHAARSHPHGDPQLHASPLQTVVALRAALGRNPTDPATRLALIDAPIALAGAAGRDRTHANGGRPPLGRRWRRGSSPCRGELRA